MAKAVKQQRNDEMLEQLLNFKQLKMYLKKTMKNAIFEYLDYHNRYSAKGTNGKWRYASSKASLKCAGRQILATWA